MNPNPPPNEPPDDENEHDAPKDENSPKDDSRPADDVPRDPLEDRETRLNHGFKPGDKIGDVILDARIGRGGMGEVWRAVDPLRRNKTNPGYVAVKLLPREVQDSQRELRRVLETYQAVSDLVHPNIAAVHYLKDVPPYGYVLVMKYVDGRNLGDYYDAIVAKHGSFPFATTRKILSQVALALDHAHNAGQMRRGAKVVIHRDVKPENILVGRDGTAQLVDFGLAAEIRQSLSRVSREPMDSVGTRPYMAPEQWRGHFQDARTDQYGLAVVAYELIAGRLPFLASDSYQLRECAIHERPEPIPGQPDHVNAALLRGLAKTRDERFATCAEFVAALCGNTRDTRRQRPLTTDPGTPDAEPADAGEDIRGDHTNPRRIVGIAAASLVVTVALIWGVFQLGSGGKTSPPVRPPDVPNGASSPAPNRNNPVAESNDGEVVAESGPAASPSDDDPPELVEAEREPDQKPTPVAPAPPLLLAPFSPSEAAARQADWAAYLKTPVTWTNSIGMRFRLIPPGRFLMGAPDGEEGASDDEKPQHPVLITRPLYVGEFPVTQNQYVAIMGKNPSQFRGSDNLPVDSVSWNDAEEFLGRLRDREDLAGYRLPTEAEWEYFCRAGTTTAFWFGNQLNGREANCDGNYPYGTTTEGPYLEKTSPAGSYPANPFGLYDTIGNVWEWCGDFYDKDRYAQFTTLEANDPGGPSTGSSRVLRGGSWDDNAVDCRCATRYRYGPTTRSSYFGFRVVLSGL